MRSDDGRAAGDEAALDGRRHRHGVRLGGVGPGGRERLHYPDMVIVTETGHRVALELELTGKPRVRRERILAGYGADPRIDAGRLPRRPSRAVGRAIQRSAARIGIPQPSASIGRGRRPRSEDSDARSARRRRQRTRTPDAADGRPAAPFDAGPGARADEPGSDDHRLARRYLSLALWAAVLLAPSVPVAAGLLAGGGAAPMLGPAAGMALAPGAAGGRPGAGDGGPARRRPVAGGRSRSASGSWPPTALIVGASGAGKSTTLLTVLDAQIRRVSPVVAIDMKGSPAFAAQLRTAAAAAGRGLAGLDAGRPRALEPAGPRQRHVAQGQADLQRALQRAPLPAGRRALCPDRRCGVLHAAHPDRPAQLHEVVALMEPRRLSALLRGVPGPLAERVQDYLAGLTGDQLSAVRGLGTRLALLSESCAGPYLRRGAAAARRSTSAPGWRAATSSCSASTPACTGSSPPSSARWSIQDLVSATGRARCGAARCGRRCRAAGRPRWRSTSSRRWTPTTCWRCWPGGASSASASCWRPRRWPTWSGPGAASRDQVLGIVGVKIVHRQDVPRSAEMIAQMAGTERVLGGDPAARAACSPAAGVGRGTRRLAERYVVHPNVIKRLAVGEAVVMTKLPTAGCSGWRARRRGLRCRPRRWAGPRRHRRRRDRRRAPADDSAGAARRAPAGSAVTTGRSSSPPGARSAGARGDAVGVEDGVDVAQAVDRLVQRARVPHLDDEPVLDHGVVDRAVRVEDVDARPRRTSGSCPPAAGGGPSRRPGSRPGTRSRRRRPRRRW